MKSLRELHELRATLYNDMSTGNNANKPKIIIGMGTCGIAAGARNILQTVLKEIEDRKIDVIVTQTGCIGMCEKEPLLDVQLPGRERITYGNLDNKAVQKIIVDHVIKNTVVKEFAIAHF